MRFPARVKQQVSLRALSVFGNEVTALVYEELEAAPRCAGWSLLWLCFLPGFTVVQFSQDNGSFKGQCLTSGGPFSLQHQLQVLLKR